MMQMNVRSEILPLTKRYWTDILCHKLRRFLIKFYTETLFSDDNFVQGNKYYQLYAYGDGFIHVFIMRSKSEADDSMGNLVNDIDMGNKIYCYNALE